MGGDKKAPPAMKQEELVEIRQWRKLLPNHLAKLKDKYISAS